MGRILFSPELKQRVLVCSLSALDRDDTIILLKYVVESFAPAKVLTLLKLDFYPPPPTKKNLFLTLFYAKTPF